MAFKDLGYQKLDSNIDGFYVDENGNVSLVNDMIGVVGATDGPPAYPANIANNAPLTESDLSLLGRSNISPTIVNNSNGHGIVYDKEGNPIAQKGDLYFKDGKGNFTNFYDLINRSKMIRENKGKTRLKDATLEKAGYTSKVGISLSELINLSSLANTSFSKGNILQAARNYKANNTSLEVDTISLKEEAIVWIIGRVSVLGDGQAILKSNGTPLQTINYAHPDLSSYPVYFSWLGSLPIDVAEPLPTGCNVYEWDFASKTFKKNVNDSNDTFYDHKITIETEATFSNGTLNVMCFETQSRDLSNVKTGSDVMTRENSDTKLDIEFDEEFPDEDYSIAIQLEDALQTWYSNKSSSGFTINIERAYSGSIYWTAIKK